MFCMCGTLLQIKKEGETVICKKCGKSVKINKIEPFIIEKVFNNEEVVNTRNKVKGAKIKERCPSCDSNEMFYNVIQLRSVDEGQTVFYEGVKIESSGYMGVNIKTGG
ncbi:subunit Rpa12 of DNA-directed RNA polymerase I [Hamiltosporidium tvaerminnensis]|uniref:DNA-directed RNA polymerase subunit n=1 Tax=Hamiltosporidium tvaerminnensis TaxID=1176355 RepID=A0A4Q9L0S1_9MICR|nr:subunit Rpa12 of DNA-directed RNA polymerase I [Hamiltosporidium tvaerminnensis]